jgi:hypothetical protein
MLVSRRAAIAAESEVRALADEVPEMFGGKSRR